MSVPKELKVKPHVFCYSPDLVDASNTLAGYLKCKVSKVYEGYFDPQSETATAAWLVGHGAKNNTIVGDDSGKFSLKIRSISDWLKSGDPKYQYLVDTCCFPNRRKNSQTFGGNYYSTNDSQCVYVITRSPDFDTWWNKSNMHAYGS